MLRYSVPPELYDQSIPQIATAKSIVMDSLSKNPLNGTETIIDACCGTGRLTEYLGEYLPDGRIFGLDKAENMIGYAKQHHYRDNVSYQLDDLTVFNKMYKKSADLIVCSWAVSHIPAEKQEAFTGNLYQYLKKNGRLIILFPVMGSLLSTTVQEIAKSEKWREYFKAFENKRMTYTVEQYDELLMQTGFITNEVHATPENIVFKDKSELLCFITTATARYLPYLPESMLRENFINDITNHYQSKVSSKDQNIPYSMTMLSAIAKKPSLALILQKTGSPIHAESTLRSNGDNLSFSFTKLTM